MGMMENGGSSRIYDVCIIGGGPAGLTAALYLARYHLSVLLVDSGESRAALIPTTHNQPFWPGGISGVALLSQMRDHVAKYPVANERNTVTAIKQLPNCFEVLAGDVSFLAELILLATGVENVRPSMSNEMHSATLERGLLRYCPICDGYEITDRRVAVVGQGERLYAEASFLRSYTSSVSVLSEAPSIGLTPGQRADLSTMGIQILDVPADQYRIAGSVLQVGFGEITAEFDTMYAALGSKVRSGIASGLGVRMTSEGCLLVDSHQRTNVQGVYAAGDLVAGLDQIGHAIGQATVAATAMRNDLCKQRILLR